MRVCEREMKDIDENDFEFYCKKLISFFFSKNLYKKYTHTKIQKHCLTKIFFGPLLSIK